MKRASFLAMVLALSVTIPLYGAIVAGQVDNFSGGTNMGWGAGGAHPEPPVVIATGGPGGEGDAYLRVTALGGNGPGSRLSVLNLAQWAGDYTNPGISGIHMDVRNFGPDEVSLRLLFVAFDMGVPAHIAVSTDAVVVPAGSDWMPVFFPINQSVLTSLLGTLEGALTSADELRLFHNTTASHPGPGVGPEPVSAVVGIDNILAVPEPGTVVLLGAGLTALLFFAWTRSNAGASTRF